MSHRTSIGAVGFMTFFWIFIFLLFFLSTFQTSLEIKILPGTPLVIDHLAQECGTAVGGQLAI